MMNDSFLNHYQFSSSGNYNHCSSLKQTIFKEIDRMNHVSFLNLILISLNIYTSIYIDTYIYDGKIKIVD